jgi:hypothetical protein
MPRSALPALGTLLLALLLTSAPLSGQRAAEPAEPQGDWWPVLTGSFGLAAVPPPFADNCLLARPVTLPGLGFSAGVGLRSRTGLDLGARIGIHATLPQTCPTALPEDGVSRWQVYPDIRNGLLRKLELQLGYALPALRVLRAHAAAGFEWSQPSPFIGGGLSIGFGARARYYRGAHRPDPGSLRSVRDRIPGRQQRAH